MTVNVNVSESTAKRMVNQMEEEKQRINNTLNSYRSNNLGHLESYCELKEEKVEIVEEIRNLEDAISKAQREECEEEEEQGLGELFS